MAKFLGVAPFTAKVVGLNMLTIEPVYDSFHKILLGDPHSSFPVGCALARLGHSVYSACKNFRAQQEPKYGYV